MSSSFSLNQKSAFDLVLSDRASVLCPSTILKYNAAFSSFLKFCSDLSVDPIPSVDLFCMYISVSCRRLNPRTVLSYLSGISRCLEPAYPSVHVISNSSPVRRVLKSCLKKFSPPVKRSQPFLLSDFDIVLKSLSSSFDDILFICLLSFGYAGLHRLGEITTPDSHLLRDPCAAIQRSSLLISSPPTHFEYVLPYSKVDQFHLGQTIVIYSNSYRPACAVSHLLAYLKVRDPTFPAHTPLFLTSSGHIPTRSWFLRRFRPLFPFQKSGHSLRSGGATYLANRGVEMSLIKEAGRWSSNAFKIYVRSNPVLRLPAALASASSAPVLPGTQLSFHPLP